ncbi:plastocyanin/azurin family copper-binding protein [Nitrosopumilus sp.]|uniref:plastocyanin/azurin family copper-binding protein n=1 Tax=Nitrosopumilus sp. TaxID=2024843 RepID=UPI0026233B63|nr:plastocyanin/azurin family copper-binding protein [Nitrosopumilus sp.]
MVAITFSLLFGTMFSITLQEAFAETVTISIPSGTAAPGCETSNSCYDPSGVLVQQGSTVKWINKDAAAHSVTSGNPTDGPDGVFDSGLIMGSYDYSFRFTSVGSYDYFCILHPWMEGNIVVFELPDEPENKDRYTPPNSNGNNPAQNNNGYDEDSRINVVLSNRITTLNYEVENLKSQLETEKTRAEMLALDKGQLRIMYDELESESNSMRQTISEQKDHIAELKDEIKSLRALAMEQLAVLNDLFLKFSS